MSHIAAPILMTTISSILGVLLWLGLLYRNILTPIAPHHLILIAFIIGLMCRVAFVLLNPIFYAPDEQSHYNYIKYLYENHRFPVQTGKTFSPAYDYEYYQPPLYYLISLPIYWVAHAMFHDNEPAIVRIIRSISIVFWLINTVFLLKILKRIHSDSDFVKVFTVSMVCLLPTYTFLSSAINNDNLLIALGSLILYCIAKESHWRKSALMGALLGIALLTKLTAIIYIFLIIFISVYLFIKGLLSLKAVIAKLAFTFTPAFIIASPWYIRNIYVYGNITAENVANIPKHWDSLFQAIQQTQHILQESFWSISGIFNNVIFFPSAGIYLTYLASAGLLCGLFSKSNALWSFLDGHGRAFIIATSAAIVVNLVLVLRFGFLYNQGQGRFMFPLLIPIALLLSIGIQLLSLGKHLKYAPIHAVGFFSIYVLSFTGFSLSMPPDSKLHAVGFVTSNRSRWA
jgi:4-amino-4-deoxy-L-arabinose transferase-like glycosyltransferase